MFYSYPLICPLDIFSPRAGRRTSLWGSFLSAPHPQTPSPRWHEGKGLLGRADAVFGDVGLGVGNGRGEARGGDGFACGFAGGEVQVEGKEGGEGVLFRREAVGGADGAAEGAEGEGGVGDGAGLGFDGALGPGEGVEDSPN